MWKSIWVVLLAGTFAQAQAAATQAEVLCQVLDCPPQPRKGEPTVNVHQSSYYNVLARGKEETFAVVLYRPENDTGCCSLTPTPNQADLVPISVSVGSAPGLVIRARSGKQLTKSDPIVIRYNGSQKVVLVKVRANDDAPLGSITVPIKVTYQRIRNEQRGAPETIDFNVPLKILKKGSTMTRAEFPFVARPLHDLGIVLLLPVLIPAMIVLWIACNTGSGCDL